MLLKISHLFIRFLEAEGLERTHKFKQIDILKAVDVSSAQNVSRLQKSCIYVLYLDGNVYSLGLNEQRDQSSSGKVDLLSLNIRRDHQ